MAITTVIIIATSIPRLGQSLFLVFIYLFTDTSLLYLSPPAHFKDLKKNVTNSTS